MVGPSELKQVTGLPLELYVILKTSLPDISFKTAFSVRVLSGVKGFAIDCNGAGSTKGHIRRFRVEVL